MTREVAAEINRKKELLQEVSFALLVIDIILTYLLTFWADILPGIVVSFYSLLIVEGLPIDRSRHGSHYAVSSSPSSFSEAG